MRYGTSTSSNKATLFPPRLSRRLFFFRVSTYYLFGSVFCRSPPFVVNPADSCPQKNEEWFCGQLSAGCARKKHPYDHPSSATLTSLAIFTYHAPEVPLPPYFWKGSPTSS